MKDVKSTIKQKIDFICPLNIMLSMWSKQLWQSQRGVMTLVSLHMKHLLKMAFHQEAALGPQLKKKKKLTYNLLPVTVTFFFFL